MKELLKSIEILSISFFIIYRKKAGHLQIVLKSLFSKYSGENKQNTFEYEVEMSFAKRQTIAINKLFI